MNCPYCDTPNDPSNQFCVHCGRSLHEAPAQATSDRSPDAKNYIFVHTFRIIVSLFGLWIINTILVGLNFIKELSIPQLPIRVTALITAFIVLIVIILLITYIRMFADAWPAAFPRLREAGSVFTALLSIVVLAVIYSFLKPILPIFTDQREPLMILQIALLIIAVILLFRAAAIVYHAIPLWFERLKQDWQRLGLEARPKD